MSLKALGHKVTTFKGFDTFPAPPNLRSVCATSDEVTALCPVTNQPDFYTIAITYWPRGTCIESKTLKLYLQSIRERGEFCEAMAARMACEIADVLNNAPVTVAITQKARGGVSLVSTAHAGEDSEWT